MYFFYLGHITGPLPLSSKTYQVGSIVNDTGYPHEGRADNAPIRMTVVPIKPLIRKIIVPITSLIHPTVVPITQLIRMIGIPSALF